MFKSYRFHLKKESDLESEITAHKLFFKVDISSTQPPFPLNTSLSHTLPCLSPPTLLTVGVPTV